ncbi:MAG: hypothetical protein U0936_18510 [Planctomycetaceae bacterium]
MLQTAPYRNGLPRTTKGAKFVRDDTYVLNHCTPFLARSNKDRRHDFGFGHYSADDDRARFREAWRFPVIDTCAQDGAQPGNDDNDVTFIFHAASVPTEAVSVVGTFGFLYQPLALRRVEFLGEATDYFAKTVRVPKTRYLFLQIQCRWPTHSGSNQSSTSNARQWSDLVQILYVGMFTAGCAPKA